MFKDISPQARAVHHVCWWTSAITHSQPFLGPTRNWITKQSNFHRKPPPLCSHLFIDYFLFARWQPSPLTRSIPFNHLSPPSGFLTKNMCVNREKGLAHPSSKRWAHASVLSLGESWLRASNEFPLVPFYATLLEDLTRKIKIIYLACGNWHHLQIWRNVTSGKYFIFTHYGFDYKC